MAYAQVTDMIARWGQAEMIRVSTPDGAEMVAVQPEPIEQALNEASAVIDSYIRRRYRVPLDVAPFEIRRAACVLARYDLATGGQREPSATMMADRKDVVVWLGQIAAGTVLLDLAEVSQGYESFATTSTRDQVFNPLSVPQPDDTAINPAPVWP